MARKTQPLLAVAALAAVVALTASAARPAADFDELQQQAIKAAVRKVAPCVVQIETSGGTDVVVAGPRGLLRRGTGPTSGLIVGADGYIVSSAFNFANKPSQIRVSVPGLKERRVAKVVATDQTRMLTLLKIDLSPGEALPLPEVSPKKDFRVGQTAIAVGRTLAASAEQPPSVSVGILSATDRIWGRAVQTDAKVSPTNYGGPLIDLQGRVQGVLVPASPRAGGELAGFEWYDSGIGFAVPLEDVNRVLPRLKAGKDLRAGVLGIQMQAADEFTVPPTVASVAPGSPAEKAGLKAGDVIKAIDGKEVHNQAQLRHQLGPKYEGDAVSVRVQRGKDEVKLDKVVLGAATAGTGQPFLGILPVRDDPGPGVEVRFVYPGSPADKAGIKAGDRITKVGRALAPGRVIMQGVVARDALLALMDAAQPGLEVKVEVTRKAGGKAETLTATLAEAPDVVPDKLPERASAGHALVKPGTKPPAPKKDAKKDDKDEKKHPTGFLKRTTAAADHTYWIYVPDNYDPNVAHAVVVWLHPTGKNKEKDFDDLTWSWQPYCEDNHVIVICPSCDAASGWTPGESEFIAETVRAVGQGYTIDRRRVVAHGMGLGGEMAYYLGFHSRNLVRGVATVGAPMTSNPKERVAAQPLAFFLVAGDKDPLKGPIKDTAAKLREHKFPTVHREVPDMGHQYIDGRAGVETFKELVRWVDSLDRL